MSLQLLPDIESIVVGYLKDQEDVLELIEPEAIAAELPPKQTGLFLQVALDGGLVPIEDWLVAARVRVEAWGGKRKETRDLAATAHAALIALSGQTMTEGFVTAVTTLLAPRKFADPVNNRPRYQLEVRVFAHRRRVTS